MLPIVLCAVNGHTEYIRVPYDTFAAVFHHGIRECVLGFEIYEKLLADRHLKQLHITVFLMLSVHDGMW